MLSGLREEKYSKNLLSRYIYIYIRVYPLMPIIAAVWKMSSEVVGAGRHCMCGTKRQAGDGSSLV